MKIISLILLSLFSLTTVAHQGHGESSLFSHDLDHALWTLGAIVIVALVYFVARKRQ